MVCRVACLLCFVVLVGACIYVTFAGIDMLVIGAIGYFGFGLRL